MKKPTWRKPPGYHGEHSNKRVLRTFSTMVGGLAVIVHNKSAAERLKTLKHRIEFQRDSANGADISSFISIVFDDLIALRDLDIDRSKSEFDAAVKLLEEDIDKMLLCIKEGLSVAPWADDTDRRVVKFSVKVAALKSIHKRAYADYIRMKSIHDDVLKELVVECDERTKRRLESKERRSYAYCDMRGTALDVLEEILDELAAIEETAKSSPSLAGRINRLINVKRLGDFYANPIKAQKQRKKLKGELLYIIQSVTKGKQYGDDWAGVMYSGTAVPKPTAATVAVEASSNRVITVQPSVAEVDTGVSINKANKNVGGF